MGFFDVVSSLLVPVGSIVVVVVIQVLVRGWTPPQHLEFEDDEAAKSVDLPEDSSLKQPTSSNEATKNLKSMENDKNKGDSSSTSFEKNSTQSTSTNTNNESGTEQEEEESEEDLFAMNDNGWRCACEGGFLPPGMLKSFGTAEAMVRLGTGQCYHKQGVR